jgi:beta-galactosidase/beta-glucuronidase
MAKQAEIKHLLTSAGEKLCGGEWDVYPRPCLVRDSFYSLNGDWELTATDGRVETVKVPYPPESVISGVGRSMGKRPHLFYRRSFSLPAGFIKDRLILHFVAIDQIATVTLNGRYIGEHIGGYGHFSYDVTDALQEENELCVEVVDELYSKILPYGKQREDRGGMWYTPVSGIWQTVWIESLPENPILSLKIDQNDQNAKIEVNSEADTKILTLESGERYELGGSEIVIEPENPIPGGNGGSSNATTEEYGDGAFEW